MSLNVETHQHMFYYKEVISVQHMFYYEEVISV